MEDRAADDTEEDPIGYRDPLKSRHCREWKTAMREEFK